MQFQIFSIAISGNIASYLQEADANFHWRYNFHLVSAAATTIIVYVLLIPFALWTAFKWTARPVDSELIGEEVSRFRWKNWLDDMDSNLNFLFAFLFNYLEWKLYSKFFGIDLHIRLFTWNLYSRVDSLGYSDFIFAMVTCIRRRTVNWNCSHHSFESSFTKLT